MPSVSYRDAGLDLEVYEQTLAGITPLLRRTHTPRVLDGFGGFASLFSLDYNTRLFARNYRHPVLVTCTDGVGTKLKIAALMNKHDTVGIDLVAMSVNDCLCTGGEPLVFLDYLAMPKDDPALTQALVKGISDGCMEADCAWSAARRPSCPTSTQPGDYDMAGFCVGVVERDHIINGRAIRPGDVVLGLASSGLHSNGYSLVRKVVFDMAAEGRRFRARNWAALSARSCWSRRASTCGRSRTSCSHYPIKRRVVRGLAHITGGGLVDNLPRSPAAGASRFSNAAVGRCRRSSNGCNDWATLNRPRWIASSIRASASR